MGPTSPEGKGVVFEEPEKKRISRQDFSKFKKKCNTKKKQLLKHHLCPCGSGKKFFKCCWHSL